MAAPPSTTSAPPAPAPAAADAAGAATTPAAATGAGTGGGASTPSSDSPLVRVNKEGAEIIPGGVKQGEPAGWVLKLTKGRVPFTRKEGDYYDGLFEMLDTGGDGTVAGTEGAMFLRRSGLGTDLLREVWRISSGGKSRSSLKRENWFLAMKLVALAQKTGEASIDALVTADALELAEFGIDCDADLSVRCVGPCQCRGRVRIRARDAATSLARSLPEAAATLSARGSHPCLRLPATTHVPVTTPRNTLPHTTTPADAQLGDPSKVIATRAIRVAVGNPTHAGAGISKHTLFTVSTTTSLDVFPRKDMAVARRYSDFVWLHQRLCYVFPGVIIPPVPAKKLVGNMEESFIEERRSGLEEYINRVVHHPRLVKALEVQVFLGSSARGFKALRKLLSTGVARGGVEDGEGGAAEFFAGVWESIASTVGSVVTSSSLPADVGIDEKYKRLCARHQAMHALLARAVAAANATETQRRATAYQMARLGTYLLEAAAHEARNERVGTAAFVSMRKRAERRRSDAAAGSGGDSGTGAGAGSSGGSDWDGATSGLWAGTDKKPAKAPAPPTSTALINPNIGVLGHARAAEQAAALFEEEDDVYAGRGEEEEYKVRTELGMAGGGTSVGLRRGSAKAGDGGGATHSDIAAGAVAAAAGAGAALEAQTTADALRVLGTTLEGASNRLQDQLDKLEKLFFVPLNFELEQAVAVKEAMARREAYLQQLAAGHASLKNKKKTYAQARAFSEGASAAEADMYKAEGDVASVERNVAAITESLKLEMTVRESQRRNAMATMILEHVRNEARHSKLRADRWMETLPYISGDEALLAASRKRTGVKEYSRESSTDVAPEPEVSPFA